MDVIDIDENTKRQVSDLLGRMTDPITLHLFLSEKHCMFCAQTKELINLIVSLAPEGKINLEICECDENSKEAKEFGIDKHPAIVFSGKNKGKVRCFGIPSGYEFGSFVEDIVDVSIGTIPALSPSTKEFIETIDKPIHIQVFVTPTCPYCTRAVRIAHSAAMLNKNIKADMVEAMEFSELANKYGVMGVPKLVFNEKWFIEGSPPEQMFIAKLKEVLE